MAPLLPGMEAPPHAMRLGDDEKAYYTVESQAPLQQGEAAEHGQRRRPPDHRHRDRGGPPPWLEPRIVSPGRWGKRIPDRRDGMAGTTARLVRGPLMRGEVPLGEVISFWILGPISLAGAIGMVVFRNAVHSALSLAGDDDLPRRLLHDRAGPVHRLRADHRLHRRDHDLVPVRPDAGRARFVRLDRRDPARAAAGGRVRRPRLRADRRDRRRPRVQRLRRRSTSARGNSADGAQRQLARPGDLHPVPVRVRADLGAADRRRASAAMVLAHVERDEPKPTQKAVARARFRSGRPQPWPGPGVLSSGDAIGTPALLPDGPPRPTRSWPRRPAIRELPGGDYEELS